VQRRLSQKSRKFLGRREPQGDTREAPRHDEYYEKGRDTNREFLSILLGECLSLDIYVHVYTRIYICMFPDIYIYIFPRLVCDVPVYLVRIRSCYRHALLAEARVEDSAESNLSFRWTFVRRPLLTTRIILALQFALHFHHSR